VNPKECVSAIDLGCIIEDVVSGKASGYHLFSDVMAAFDIGKKVPEDR